MPNTAQTWLVEQEQFRVIALNIKNQVINVSTVYKGNVNSAVVRASEVFQDAVRSNCPRSYWCTIIHQATPTPALTT